MEKIGVGVLMIGAALGVGAFIFGHFLEMGYSVATREAMSRVAEYAEGFYGRGYVPVLYGLYEYNPFKGNAYPNPIIFAIAGIIALTGLVLYAIGKRL